ncbi:hypothetical protein LSH36_54g02004, partial [Paralvinella palmiformis]
TDEGNDVHMSLALSTMTETKTIEPVVQDIIVTNSNGTLHATALPEELNNSLGSANTENEYERETWGKKVDFLLSVIGFAVDLGNVWRFPYICYKNGGGAFLIPYMIMLVFGGLPLFYMELALGQYQKVGCITIWSRICPMFKGIGYGICLIAMYVGVYYNTIIAWAVYYLVASFSSQVPWATCNNSWNSKRCRATGDLWGHAQTFNDTYNNTTPSAVYTNQMTSYQQDNYAGSDNRTFRRAIVSPAEEYFMNVVLEMPRSNGIENIGNIKWSLSLCLLAVLIIVYFALWKGIKSSGKVVWITATMPYIVLFILLIRGVTLPGSVAGMEYYLKPEWHMLKKPGVWLDAAAQVFFSLGPGFGVLMALSSYNSFHNNCYRDALITATINCLTSFLAGFVVFSVLGYMAYRLQTTVDLVAERGGPGLVFVVYPEAISTLSCSSFWSVLFFLMLITLGLDSTFGGLEALITGVCDEWPVIRRHRELFVAGLITVLFLCALPTCAYGGNYVLALLDAHGAPSAILFICFVEAIAVNWFYG